MAGSCGVYVNKAELAGPHGTGVNSFVVKNRDMMSFYS